MFRSFLWLDAVQEGIFSCRVRAPSAAWSSANVVLHHASVRDHFSASWRAGERKPSCCCDDVATPFVPARGARLAEEEELLPDEAERLILTLQLGDVLGDEVVLLLLFTLTDLPSTL